MAAHTGYLTAGGMGGVNGIKQPFAKATLAAFYSEPGSYQAKFVAATDRQLAGRWITAEDADALKRSFQTSHP